MTLRSGRKKRAARDAAAANRVTIDLIVVGPEEGFLTGGALGFGSERDAFVVRIGQRGRMIENAAALEAAGGGRHWIAADAEDRPLVAPGVVAVAPGVAAPPGDYSAPPATRSLSA